MPTAISRLLQPHYRRPTQFFPPLQPSTKVSTHPSVPVLNRTTPHSPRGSPFEKVWCSSELIAVFVTERQRYLNGHQLMSMKKRSVPSASYFEPPYIIDPPAIPDETSSTPPSSKPGASPQLTMASISQTPHTLVKLPSPLPTTAGVPQLTNSSHTPFMSSFDPSYISAGGLVPPLFNPLPFCRHTTVRCRP